MMIIITIITIILILMIIIAIILISITIITIILISIIHKNTNLDGNYKNDNKNCINHDDDNTTTTTTTHPLHAGTLVNVMGLSTIEDAVLEESVEKVKTPNPKP